MTSPSALGIDNGSGAPDMYRFQFASGLQIGPFPNQLQSALSDSYVYLDTVSWTKGHHSLRFGAEVDRTSIRRNLPVLDNGLLFFVPGGVAGLDYWQNFLLGSETFGEGGGGAANHDYIIPAFAGFAQDDWRATQTLTLNLGLRMEWVGAAYDNLCHLGNAIPGNANLTGVAFVYPSCVSKFGIPGLSGTLNSAALNNEYARVPEPRIGFAYDVGGKHSTVVRSGYGIYSVREDIGAVDNLSFTAPIYPVLVTGNAPYNGTPGTGMAGIFAGAPPLGNGEPGFLADALHSSKLIECELSRRDTCCGPVPSVLWHRHWLYQSGGSAALGCTYDTTVELLDPTPVGQRLGARTRIRGHQGNASAFHL